MPQGRTKSGQAIRGSHAAGQEQSALQRASYRSVHRSIGRHHECMGARRGDAARRSCRCRQPGSAAHLVAEHADAEPGQQDRAVAGRQRRAAHAARHGERSVLARTSATLAGTPRARTADVNSQQPLDATLGGVVTTDTVTLAGQDFYNWFAQAWGAIPLSERYIVSVHERPSARYGSLVWVEFGQRRVFQAFLPIARSNVRPVAEDAAQVAFQNVMQADLTRLLFRDADMATDEL